MLGWILLCVLILTCVACLGIFYLIYSNTPEKAFRDRFLAYQLDVHHKLRLEHKLLDDLPRRKQANEDALRNEAYARLLSSVPTRALLGYPGLGEATIARLESHGYSNLVTLASAGHSLSRISGVGDKKLGDIQIAVRDLVSQTGRKFQQGGFPEARTLQLHLESLAVGYAERELLCRARFQALASLHERFATLRDSVGQIRFAAFLLERAGLTALPAIPTVSFPDVDNLLQETERQARSLPASPAQRTQPPAMPRPLPVEPPQRDVRPSAYSEPPRTVREQKGAELASPRTSSAKGVSLDPFKKSPPSPGRTGPIAADSQARRLSKQDLPRVIIELSLQFLFLVARSNGKGLVKGKKAILTQFQRRYQNDQALLNLVNGSSIYYETAGIDIDHCLQQMKDQFSPAHRQSLVNFARHILEASKDISPEEAAFLNKAARRLEVEVPPLVAGTRSGGPNATEATRASSTGDSNWQSLYSTGSLQPSATANAPPSSPPSAAQAEGREPELQMDLFLQVAFAVSRVDGHIAKKEKEVILQWITRHCAGNANHHAQAMKLFEEYQVKPLNVAECLESVKSRLSVNQQKELVQLAFDIAEASRGINPREAELLREITTRLRIDPLRQPIPRTLEAPKRSDVIVPATDAPPGRLEALTLLEIDPAWKLTVDLIRRQYQHLSARYAPERMVSMGADFIGMADLKRAALGQAAVALLEPLGARLDVPAQSNASADLRHNPDLDSVLGI